MSGVDHTMSLMIDDFIFCSNKVTFTTGTVVSIIRNSDEHVEFREYFSKHFTLCLRCFSQYSHICPLFLSVTIGTLTVYASPMIMCN